MSTSSWKPKVGWAITAITGLGLIASASGKLMQPEQMVQMFTTKFGFPLSTLRPIGVVEILIAVLYLIPRTSFVGAILISAYLGGAVCTHLRVGDPFIIPIVLGVLAWVGYGLRNEHVMRPALGLPNV